MGLTTGLIAACVTAGCRSTGPKPLPVHSQEFVTDVPMPKGFKLDDDRSTDMTSGRNRSVWHEYKGRANLVSIRNFFRDQMPLSRWTLLSDQNAKGDYTIIFEKDGETCIIFFKSTRGGFDNAMIRVTISKMDRSTGTPSG
jgi:hypothetical protein